jgi:uncharacterized protein YndB with AHSA1/START domain
VESSIKHSTFIIKRHYPKPAPKVFAAFADPAKKRRWFAEGPNNQVDEFEMDFQIGGIERSRYRYPGEMPFAGVPFVNEGRYLYISTGRTVVTASTMTVGDRCISASLNTVELMPVGDSRTDLIFTFQGAFLEGADGPEVREAGWNKLFERLEAELVSS